MSLLIRPLILWDEGPILITTLLPNALSPKTVTRWLRASQMNLGRGGHNPVHSPFRMTGAGQEGSQGRRGTPDRYQ